MIRHYLLLITFYFTFISFSFYKHWVTIFSFYIFLKYTLINIPFILSDQRRAVWSSCKCHSYHQIKGFTSTFPSLFVHRLEGMEMEEKKGKSQSPSSLTILSHPNSHHTVRTKISQACITLCLFGFRINLQQIEGHIIAFLACSGFFFNNNKIVFFSSSICVFRSAFGCFMGWTIWSFPCFQCRRLPCEDDIDNLLRPADYWFHWLVWFRQFWLVHISPMLSLAIHPT